MPVSSSQEGGNVRKPAHGAAEFLPGTALKNTVHRNADNAFATGTKVLCRKSFGD